MTQGIDLSAFHPPIHIGSDTTLPVYISTSGTKPLIVLHELPGMSPSFIDYCRRMADEGFKVYMPLMFKSPGTQMGGVASLAFCLSREFRALFAARDRSKARPFTAWLLELVDSVSTEHPDQNIGVVGMCLTGGFAIAAIAAPQVSAVIACQPSMPVLFDIKTLGLSDAERRNVQDGKTHKAIPCAKAYRFQSDRICKEAHMAAAQTLLGPSLERYPDLPGKGHSTLTTQTASPEVYQDVLTFLQGRV